MLILLTARGSITGSRLTQLSILPRTSSSLECNTSGEHQPSAMKTLFLLFAALLFFSQIIPGNSQPAPDTLVCRRSHHGFCKYNCPGETLPTGGTCQSGRLVCCKSPWNQRRW
ncbi:gallinacin-9 [Protobothrops mucrosquamatus]|uniref:gallinacin-9 n=1 Tax=Protobothrops mucrosquamatus TaxID=103944 RepID=UPI000775D3E4|nr:gallinacin-9 [Protobothrops mucrosquamatus]